MKAIWRRDFLGYFHTGLGWLFLSLFALATGLLFAYGNLLGRSADLPALAGSIQGLLLFSLPLLTMRSFAEERRKGTERLYLASPLAPWAVVAGKFLAAFCLYLLALLPFLLAAGAAAIWGDPPPAQSAAALLGLILAGATWLALGLLLSSLVEQQAVAAVAGMASVLVLQLLEGIAGALPPGFLGGIPAALLGAPAFTLRQGRFTAGILCAEDVVFLAGLSLLLLALTRLTITARSSPRAMRRRGFMALALATAMFLSLTALLGRLPLRLDLSADRLFSLSPQSRALLASLDRDILVTACWKAGEAPPEVAEHLALYGLRSPRVSLAWVDVEENPGFATRHRAGGIMPGPGSLVVAEAGGGRWVTIPWFRLYEFEYQEASGERVARGLRIEREVTGAIASLLPGGEGSRLRELRGHGEPTLEEWGLTAEAAARGFEILPLDLAARGAPPADGGLLLIFSPKADLSPDEASAIEAWLGTGGDLALFLDPGLELPRLEGLLRRSGLERLPGIVMEGDEGARLAGRPFFLLPRMESHELQGGLASAGLSLTWPGAGAFSASDESGGSYTARPLIRSSPSSWLRADGADNGGLARPGEPRGPFALAWAMERALEDGASSRIFVAGGSFFLSPDNPAPGPANREFFLAALSWAAGRGDDPGIRTADFGTRLFQADGRTSLLLLGVFVVALPAGIALAGFLALRGRRRS
jgi:ABC-2 type transport system permease protein